MKPVKRVEIIVPSIELPKVIDALKDININNYSVIRSVIGCGDRGCIDTDLGSILTNDYLLTTCDPDQGETVANTVRPILKRNGGLCLISDASWVIHY